MRGIRAAASLACLAWAGCTFNAPSAGDGDGKPQAEPDTPPVPACMTDPSYAEHGAHRYKLLSQSVTYDTAIHRCAAEGGHLAVVETAAENDYLRTLYNGDVWLGFDDLTEEGAFRWITGTAPDFLGWASNEPNDNGVEDCTYLRTSSGTWNDTGCADLKRPVCECDPEYRAPEIPACRTATTGFAIRLGRRYFYREAKTWQQAKADCESIGAHLVVIGDLDENIELDAVNLGPTWLGYTDAAAEGSFRWVNDAPSSFNRWPGGTVPQDDGLDCAVLQDSGSWGNVSCDESYAYTCECDPMPP